MHCGDVVLGRYYDATADGDSGKVHAACWPAWTQARAPRCSHCAGPVCRVEGRFSGKYYSVGQDREGDGGTAGAAAQQQIHAECIEAWKEARAVRCSECGRPVTGRYHKTGAIDAGGREGRVHPECLAAWRLRRRR